MWCLVTDGNLTYCGEHFLMYINPESCCYAPETNTILHCPLFVNKNVNRIMSFLTISSNKLHISWNRVQIPWCGLRKSYDMATSYFSVFLFYYLHPHTSSSSIQTSLLYLKHMGHVPAMRLGVSCFLCLECRTLPPESQTSQVVPIVSVK